MPDQNYTETPNIKFKKPDPDRIALIEDLNGNFDKADEEFVKKQNKEEPTLPTEDKTILGAIIEIFKELWKTGSATQFGRFKVGKNLNVDENGFLNGNDPYSHPVGNGNSHLPKDGSSGKFIKWLSAGVGQWSNITWSDITGKPSSFTPSSHSQASNTITTMTGYTKPSSTSAIRESDSLNTAMGKLEKGLEGKSPNSHTHTGGQITQDTAHRFVTDTEKATWNNKLNRGSLPLEIVDAKGLYDLIENNSGLKFDKNLLFLTETGTKYVDNIYFDPNKKGLFKCIKQTTTTVNSTTYFVDISNEANSNKLENLTEIQIHYQGNDKYNGKLLSGHPKQGYLYSLYGKTGRGGVIFWHGKTTHQSQNVGYNEIDVIQIQSDGTWASGLGQPIGYIFSCKACSFD